MCIYGILYVGGVLYPVNVHVDLGTVHVHVWYFVCWWCIVSSYVHVHLGTL